MSFPVSSRSFAGQVSTPAVARLFLDSSGHTINYSICIPLYLSPLGLDHMKYSVGLLHLLACVLGITDYD